MYLFPEINCFMYLLAEQFNVPRKKLNCMFLYLFPETEAERSERN
jgi:hypothetical protein